MQYMKYGKYIALIGLVLYLIGILFGQMWMIFAVMCLVGLVMMLINGVTKTADKAYNETIPKTIGTVKRTARQAADMRDIDTALDSFLQEHGGLWILETTQGIELITQSGERIPFNSPQMRGYVPQEKLDEHLARKYNCELRKHYDTTYHGGSDGYYVVNYNINGDISSISTNDSVSHHYKGATLVSRKALKAEKAERRKYYMGD